MKGDLRIWFIKVVIVGIVIAVAMYFLVYVQPFDLWFLNSAKYKLVKYATCSLALCSNGINSPQVDKVGCLEYEGGRCVKTCHTVRDELIATSQPDASGNHFCGEGNAIEFSFEPTFPVDIRSGEIQKLSTPKWVCKGVTFLGEVVRFSEGFENFRGECVMYGELEAKENIAGTKATAIGYIEKEEAIGDKSSCFRGWKNVVLTPLMEYRQTADSAIIPNKKIEYSSALYLTNQFFTGSNPECEITSNGPKFIGEGSPAGGVTADTVSNCKIRTTDAGGKRKFKVWSVNDKIIPNVDFIDRGKLGGGERCAYAVLDTDVGGVPPFTKPVKIPAAAQLGKNEVMPSLAIDDKNNIYLFYHIFEGKNSDIYYVTSNDGGSTWSSPQKITDGKQFYSFASAAFFKGNMYVSYTADNGADQEVFVRELGSTSQTKISNDPTNFDGDSELAVFGDKLYIFWNHLEGGKTKINYRISTDAVSLDPPIDKNPYEVPNAPDTSINPSAIEFSGKLWLAYTVITSGGADIHVKNTDGASWSDVAKLSEDPATDSDNQADLVAFDNNLYIFFHRGSEDPLKNPSGFNAQIRYYRFDGNLFRESVKVAEGNYLIPSILQVGDKLVGALMSYDSDWDIFQTMVVLEGQGTQQATESEKTDAGQQTEIANSISVNIDPPGKTSYKQGATVKFIGKLAAESPEDKEINLRLRAHFETLGSIEVPDFPKTVVTDKDGNFAIEYKLSNAGIGTYRMTAMYDRNVATAEFKVTG